MVCEDISPRLGSYGDPVALTPVLDRFAREGVRFTRMFSSSGVCAPSRAALITGMYATAIGANNMRTSTKDLPDHAPYEAVPPPAVRPFAEYLRAAGYYTTNNAKTDYQFTPPLTAWDESGRDAHWKNRPEGMPFFSVFNLETTHESQVWDRANDPVVVPPERVILPPYYPDSPAVRRDVARVYSNVAIMDRQVGELLAELEEAGVADDTIVVFYSDNGGPLPRGKRELLDSGLHVPFMIRFPDGAHAATVVDDLVAFVDVPATILSLAGVPVPKHMQGRPFWGDQKAPPREYVFAARDRMDEQVDHVRAARDRRFKYIRNYRTDLPRYQDITYRRQMAAMQDILRLRDEGRLDPVQSLWFQPTKPAEELYDTEADPHEVRDLSGDPAYGAHLERLRAALDGWLRRDRRPAGAPRGGARRAAVAGPSPAEDGRAGDRLAGRRRSPSSARPRARRSPTRWTGGVCAPATGGSTRGRSRQRAGPWSPRPPTASASRRAARCGSSCPDDRDFLEALR